MTQLKVYNVISINHNSQIAMVSIILTMGMFSNTLGTNAYNIWGNVFVPKLQIARPCYKLVKELTAQRLWE